jgi:membrane-bound serine protease (ClpP class)
MEFPPFKRRRPILRRAARVALVLLAMLAAVRLAAQADKNDADPPPRAYETPILIRFEGEISTLNEQFFYRALGDAKSRGADLVIVEINSPGGLLDESLNLAHRLRDVDWARTVAYVPNEAISGGAIMALGCDEIVMDENAQIGDAGAIYMDQLWFFQYADAKTRTYLTGQVRTLAEAKGRPPLLAEAMVDKDLVVHRVRDLQTNEERLMSQEQLDKAEDPARWEKIERIEESAGGRYLQLSGRRAVELKLADANADDVDDLVRRYKLSGPPPVIQWGWVDTTVMILTHWITTVLLIIVGLVALYIELTSPGISVGGLIAGLCFVLFFWSHFMGGTAGILEIILFLAGVVFLGVEIFVIPGTGVTGVMGVLLIVASLVLASQTFVIPTSGHDVKSLIYSLAVVVGALGGFVLAVMIFGRHMGSLPVFNRLILRPPSADQLDEDLAADDETPAEGKPKLAAGGVFAPQVGDYGVADSPLRPAGKVRFGEEFVDVVTDGTFVDAGQQVRVIQSVGNRIVVREVETRT